MQNRTINKLSNEEGGMIRHIQIPFPEFLMFGQFGVMRGFSSIVTIFTQ